MAAARFAAGAAGPVSVIAHQRVNRVIEWHMQHLLEQRDPTPL